MSVLLGCGTQRMILVEAILLLYLVTVKVKVNLPYHWKLPDNPGGPKHVKD
jgi:hypothetical protein